MMLKKNNQLTLKVSLKSDATFDNYRVGVNQQLIAALKSSAERFIYFYGKEGVGRTHLLQAVCHATSHSVYLPFTHSHDFSPVILDDLEQLSVVCLDDINVIASQPAWEEALFHLYNRIQCTQTRLIMTANVVPHALGIKLPDLLSRLNASLLFQLQPLSDEEKLVVLIRRAEERGMHLSEDVAKFILTHSPRQMTTLFAALETLDKMSLSAQRKLTIPFVKEVLQI